MADKKDCRHEQEAAKPCDQIELFHRSNTPLEIGTVLRGGGLANNVPEIEDAFEGRRPGQCLSRRSAVFMTDDARRTLDGVHGTYVYRVRPCCRVERRDNVLYGNVQKAYLKRTYAGRPDGRLLERFPDWNEQTVAANVDAYWTNQSENPNWEYLTCKAVVVELIAA